MNVENIRFQLEINGKPICISGVNGFGVLSAIVTWAKRDPTKFDSIRLSHSSLEDFSREEMRIEFGGLDSNRHQSWHQEELRVGDVVAIRILDPGPIDEPK